MTLELNFGTLSAVITVLGSLWLIARLLLGDEFVYIPEKKRHNWKSINILGGVEFD